MINWDDALIEAIGRRRSVIVIGSGISRNSKNIHGKRPETWENFLKSAAKSIGNPVSVTALINQRDYLTACDVIKKNWWVSKFFKFNS